ncbi:carboxymethylenebutenolidase [Actinosynnema sp. ALI-1.44]|uniref:dienelactone hydrolase family protein n=1 Tax=Actinosynnema sp. ALI-1.44 TaxID=1933779 RepID=UPI00097C93CD|nr:dienelactone hydrolase family protein [Actinosynnema sp. ALI-1.44]ONI81168.1 carboxymethylenebutenolidase [Actinosynnema sp. ALI-1.44]
MRTQDGEFDLKIWSPSGGGPAVLVIQEIFGVGDYIEAVAADLVELGYVAAAPDMFWRLRPGWRAGHDEDGLAESIDLAGRFDFATGIKDVAAAFDHLTGLPEVTGGVGLLGFCFGGTVAFASAAEMAPAAVASFYGSGVPAHLDLLDRIKAPLQLHFGGQDPYIPAEKVADVAAAVEGRPNVELHIQPDGGHAFHNRVAPMFHQPEPAERAWALTVDFLRGHLV